jgi:8-oxo-dGTP pyrophosphatase MutT (NUDIX family)
MTDFKKWTSAGGVVFTVNQKQIHICIVAPTNGYGGYTWTFPKGRMESGESKESTAVREVAEEAGVVAEIEKFHPYLGLFSGTSSNSHYFVMRAVGSTAKTDGEMAETKWATIPEARKLLNSSRDQSILDKFEEWLMKYGESKNV